VQRLSFVPPWLTHIQTHRAFISYTITSARRAKASE